MRERVLLVIEGTYPWYRGGVSEWIYQYLKHLTTYDFTILQIATDEFQGLNPDEALYPLTENVKEFIRVSPPELSFNWLKDSEKWVSAIDESLELALTGAVAIHVTNTGFAGWLGVFLKNKSRLPLVLTEHALYWKEVEKGAIALECGYKIPKNGSGQKYVAQLFKEIASEVYTASDEVISVSRTNIPSQILYGASSPVYIPNGISIDSLVSSKTRTRYPTIGWVGRCAEMKNPHLFLDAVQECVQSGFKANYIMLLCDANEKKLQDQIKKRQKDFPQVEFVWNKEAASFYSKMDMLCITSHNESQPLVMLEGLANRVLPIGWEVGDLTSEFGFVVPEGVSVQTFCNQVESLWKDKRKYTELVESKFEHVAHNHTWGIIFKKYHQLLSQLLAKERYMQE